MNDRVETAPEPTKGEERHRLQLDFSPEAYAHLLAIRKHAKARTNAEVVRTALRLYEWFLEQKQEQFEIQLVKGDTVKAVELLL
jgi:hypothetical protein